MTDQIYPMVIKALSKEDGGGFIAFAPDLYGCIADGETREAALADLHKAIDEWLDEAREQNISIPEPDSCHVRAREEREELDGLLKAQSELIKTQDQLLKSSQQEMERIKAGVTLLLERHERTDPSELAWSRGGVGVIAGPRRRALTTAH